MFKSFHKRELPAPAIDFTSEDGRQIFAQAFGEGNMVNFFLLVAQFRTQDEPAFCGLGSLAMVLNALNIDPKRIWKGNWRWFHEEMLDCCEPLDVIKEKGITFMKLVCLGRCNNADVDYFKAPSDAPNPDQNHDDNTTVLPITGKRKREESPFITNKAGVQCIIFETKLDIQASFRYCIMFQCGQMS
eukprot:m.114323 g.114323  ORF g.114323 m.114323 type:complete len:187 (+) comp14161_c0_seq3:83-643(+)